MAASENYDTAKQLVFKKFENMIKNLGKKFSIEDSDIKSDIYAELAIKFGHVNSNSINDVSMEESEYNPEISDKVSVASGVSVKRRSECIVPEPEKRARPEISNENFYAPLWDREVTLSELTRSETNKTNEAISPKNIIRKSGRVPPIVCFNTNIKELERVVKNLKHVPRYKVINVNSSKTVLKPETVKDQKVLFDLLKSRCYNAYTFTPPEEKPKNLLLKGVHHSYEEDEVKEAIQAALPEGEIIKVKRFSTPFSRGNGVNLNAYLVQLHPSTSTDEIRRIRFVLHQKVTWENLKSSGITQCKNCQNYGHVAANCSAPYRCVKCRGGHNPGECSNIKDTASLQDPAQVKKDPPPPYCVLCKKEGHTSNYRGCPAYKRIIEQRRRKSAEAESRKTEARKSVSNYVQQGKSFASLLNQNSDNKPANKEAKPKRAPSFETNSFMTSECHELFGMSMFSLIGKINEFLPKYKTLKNKQERQEAYLGFAFSLCK